eukprot:TRINITY_DN14327_c0_g1_i1.p1 TRINITY_DN14327_c0_g1~~TRINITY_DN14327_c0_g1_i1.p1  ORF type:complete len:349 (-),score=105.32 TRINITY_DN14327_c0_g1_i1:73-1119(-)
MSAASVATILDSVFMFLLMTGIGSTLEWAPFLAKFKRPGALIAAMVCQFLINPPAAYLISRALDLSPPFAVGMIVMCSCPGGAISNMLCLVVRADVDLSVAMTTASSVLSLGMMPLSLFLLLSVTGISSTIHVDYLGIGLASAVVVAGTFLGLYIRHRSERIAKYTSIVGAIAGVFIVIWSFLSNAASDAPIWDQESKVYLGAAIPPFIGAFSGFLLATALQLPKPSRIAITIETCMQNKLVALSIIHLTLSNKADADAAFTVPAFYAGTALTICLVVAVVGWKTGQTEAPAEYSVRQLISTYRADKAARNLLVLGEPVKHAAGGGEAEPAAPLSETVAPYLRHSPSV